MPRNLLAWCLIRASLAFLFSIHLCIAPSGAIAQTKVPSALSSPSKLENTLLGITEQAEAPIALSSPSSFENILLGTTDSGARSSALEPQDLVPPPPPDKPPLISLTYAEDADGDAVADRLSDKVIAADHALRSAKTAQAIGKAQAGLDEMVTVELIFSEPIEQWQIDRFLSLGGDITYIYKAVSYGWNGRIPLKQIGALPADLREKLVLIEEAQPLELTMRIASQTGRVRPVWANGFAGSSGYDGDSNISIAILDTGLSGGHTDLTGRQAYWHDYTPDAATTPIDIVQHGSHVAGIALGTGASLGTGTTLAFTQSDDLTGAPSGFIPSRFDFPPGPTIWTISGRWVGTQPTTLHELYSPLPGIESYSSLISYSVNLGSEFWASFTLPSSFSLSPGLFTNGAVERFSTLNSLTNFSPVGDGFNTLRGVAPACQWVGAKVFTNSGPGTSGYANNALDDLVLNRATYNIKVMNLSFAYSEAVTSTRQKVNTAANNGILPVVSAGNDGPSGAINDPARAAMALTVGAANDVNELTEYSSLGFPSPGSTAGEEEDYKPDVLAPGGSNYHSLIMSVDSNDADAPGSVSYYSDFQPNDYYNISGTSMASPFAAGCAALVIDALQTTGELTGASWSFSNSNDARRVKMLLCATATETNANREASTGGNPTLQRASSGPEGFPAGKDKYEGYGILNVDAAIEGGTVYLTGSTYNETLGGSDTARRAWSRKVSLTSGQPFSPILTVPGTGDFDMYLYSFTPSGSGTPIVLASSANAGNGALESLSYTPGSSQAALLVIKRVSGSGQFSLCQGSVYYRDDDTDGYGVDGDTQTLCAPSAPYTATQGGDCDDSYDTCTTDCITDLDADTIPDCRDDCIDRDGDGYGDGTACLGLDCNDYYPSGALSVSISPTEWSIGDVGAGGVETMTSIQALTVTNDGNSTGSFSLQITNPGAGWTPGATQGVETYVLQGIFCGAPPDDPSSYFTTDDVLSTTDTPSTATIFGDTAMSADGVSVPACGSVKLWLQFSAPAITSIVSQQDMQITVTIQAD